MATIALTGGDIEFVWVGTEHPGRPTIVMLHEGLGSVSLWREFPRLLAEATRCRVLVYSRHGYGRSAPLPGPRAVSYMHDEALLVLPGLLEKLGVAEPLLFGHSDGGSIALIHVRLLRPPAAASWSDRFRGRPRDGAHQPDSLPANCSYAPHTFLVH
jgi:pimeloyl-ACP methyl ester carboxylesterase